VTGRTRGAGDAPSRDGLAVTHADGSRTFYASEAARDRPEPPPRRVRHAEPDTAYRGALKTLHDVAIGAWLRSR
jgi:hypothetical protein